jgi:hypothetical protein
MDLDPHNDPIATVRLVVADWTVDPEVVVETCRAQAGDAQGAVRIVVPAWLHGIDWAGDPRASVPCAQRQLERLTGLCIAAGLPVESAAVGDPDPLSAIGDAVVGVAEILLFARGRHVAGGYPLSVARRAERLTGLPVRRIAAPRGPSRRRRPILAGGHCQAAPRSAPKVRIRAAAAQRP